MYYFKLMELKKFALKENTAMMKKNVINWLKCIILEKLTLNMEVVQS